MTPRPRATTHSHPATFWTYVVTALQTVSPGLSDSVLPLLQSAHAPIETVLATLINKLSTLPRPRSLPQP